MPCYHPIEMARHKFGKLTKTGKAMIVSVKDINAGKVLTLPCGRCIGCRLERSRQWAVRCMAEKDMHEYNEFLTLTYHDDSLTYGGAEHGILVPRDLTLFFKRLRKHYGSGLKHFSCGEYGDKFNRPHYHAIVFGLHVTDKADYPAKGAHKYFSSPTLDYIWGNGNCIVGDVSFDSCAYVARYLMKKQLGKGASIYADKGITPEFVRMSRGNAKTGPNGIGRTWLDNYAGDVYPRGNVVVNGHLSKPPRYYDNYWERVNPEDMERIRREREEIALENPKSRRQLRISERVKSASISGLSRVVE